MKHHARNLLIISGLIFGVICIIRSGRDTSEEITVAAVSKSVVIDAPVQSPAPLSLVVDQPDRAPSSTIEDWAEQFHTASEANKIALHQTGLALAKERRARLKSLIQSDPQASLAKALPWSVRQSLPAEFHQYLEQPVNIRGNYGVLVGSDFEKQESNVDREVFIGGQRYRAFVYGKKLGEGSAQNVPLNGISIDDVIALSENPIRVLDMDEALALKTVSAASDPVCVITGKPADAVGQEIAIEVAGDIHYACRASHLYSYEQWIAGDTGGITGSGDLPVAMDSWSQGLKSLLFIRVNFPDDLLDPISESAAYDLMNRVNDWMVENSYDTTSLNSTVTPLLTLPNTKAFYSEIGDSQLLTDARAVAKAAGYDTADFDLDAVRFRSVPGYSYGGKAYVRGKGCWLQSSSLGVVCHELGHNYGLWHANYWQASNNSIIGPGTHKEYGDIFDTMGSASAGDKHFSAGHRNKIDWLGDSYIHDANSSGTYRIHAFDIPVLAPDRHYAINVKRDYDREYWVELRHLFASNKYIQNGVLLRWDPWSQSSGGAHLLDTTPGSPAGNSSKDDAALVLGRTFADVAAGIYITPVAMQGTGTGKSVDVVVNTGNFSGNQLPTIAIQAGAAQATTGEEIIFTATANDADGDVLAYDWDFGDLSFGANSPVATNLWSSAGDYVVRCRVSDMKGGFASAFTVVRIGSPTTHTIAGRITDVQGNPIEGVHVSNGSTSTSSYRGSYTDTDGNFVIARLSGSHTISAALYGFDFALIGGWSNALDVSTDLTGIDFRADAEPVVGIELVDAIAAEDSNNPGTFRFSRTGSTASSLSVKYLRTGTSGFSSDYTLSPTPGGSSPYSVTIPAGADHIDVVATPNQDTLIEDAETLILTLDASSSYVIGAKIEATLYILDDESPNKPNLTVSSSSSSADNRATESGSDQGIFTISRYINRNDDITVRFTFEGTATAGTDYIEPAGSVVMRAGETSVNVAFHPLDDSLVEGDETVILKLTSDENFQISSGTATVTIQDDDPTLVTVFSNDTLAIEGTSNKAQFVVRRAGNLTVPLTVNYTTTGTATQGVDYTSPAGSIVIPSGSASATVSISALTDSEIEGDETVALVIQNNPNYNIGMPGSAVITIQDDELPTVTLTKPDSTATEGGDNARFTFARTAPTAGDLVVEYSVSGNAITGEDYVPLTRSVTIPDGSGSIDLEVTPLNDSFKEDDESMTLQLVSGANYNVGTTDPVTITIKDDDGSGSVAIGFESAAHSRIESNTSVKLPVVLSGSTSGNVTVLYAVVGGTAESANDHNLAAGTLTIPSGDKLGTINFYLVNDSVKEPDETIVIRLSSPLGAVLDVNTTHTLTITDDDAGVVTVSAVDPAADESGDAGMFRISRTGGTAGDLPVYFQIAGSASSPGDYAPLPASIVIPSGASSVDLPVTPVADETEELDETVTLRLTSVDGGRVGSPSLATVTIADVSGQVTLPLLTISAVDAETTEGVDDLAQFRVVRSENLQGELSANLSISGTATAGSDFVTFSSTIIFTDGQSEAIIDVQAIGDGLEEPLEDLAVTVTTSSTYNVAAPTFATILFIDSPFMGWQIGTFDAGEYDDENVSGADADPDHDGVVNFVEYAFNRNPHEPDAERFVQEELVPLLGSGESILVVTYHRRIVRSGFQYVLSASGDLSEWDDDPINFEELEVVDDENGITETVKARALYPTLHYDQIFVVLRVVKD